MASLHKTVLMMQPSKRQGQIWQAALKSQQIAVIWEAADIDLGTTLTAIKTAGLSLPDLLLIDVGIAGMNPYAFCRWCRENHPALKIILTNANQKEVSDTERQWAVYQGAEDLLPAFQQNTLLTGVTHGLTRVLEILGSVDLQQDSLIQTLFTLTSSQATVKQIPGLNSNGHAAASSLGSTNGHQIDIRKPLPIPSPAPTHSAAEVEEETADSEPSPQRRYRGIAY